MLGCEFLSAWERYQYIVATVLSFIAVIVAVITAGLAWKIYKFQKRDHQKEVLSSVASEFYVMFIKNYGDLYKELMPIALKEKNATVEECLKLLAKYPLRPDFPYWSQYAGSVFSILEEKYHDEGTYLARWTAIETFVRTAQKFTIRISSLKKDLKGVKEISTTYFDTVDESSMGIPYIDIAQSALSEMYETIQKLPDDLPIRSLKKE
ncbi:MAG: hypothetical protein LUH55_14490 [Bacteroides thetaiotaomicron]|nr:hypothetical protein [Bacteroides thetaiotaomicron]